MDHPLLGELIRRITTNGDLITFQNHVVSHSEGWLSEGALVKIIIGTWLEAPAIEAEVKLRVFRSTSLSGVEDPKLIQFAIRGIVYALQASSKISQAQTDAVLQAFLSAQSSAA